MQALVRVLDELEREAERVLASPNLSAADHETVARLLLDLEIAHARLALAKESTRTTVDGSLDTMRSARSLLDRLGRRTRTS